jgi:hypothetical protein
LTRSLSSCAPPEPRRSFANDFLLTRDQDNLIPLLKKIISARVPWRLYAPEGLDTCFLAQSQELCNLLKASQSQNIYLPVENVDDSILVSLNRKHVKLRHVVQAAENIGRAGFRMRHQGVSGYSCTMGGFLGLRPRGIGWIAVFLKLVGRFPDIVHRDGVVRHKQNAGA